MKVALHSVLVEGAEEDYDREHERIPDDLAATFARIGVRDWSIWRSGLHLFHLVDCDDYAAVVAALVGDPADERWQQHIGRFVDHFEATGSGPGNQVLPHVWSLSSQTSSSQASSSGAASSQASS